MSKQITKDKRKMVYNKYNGCCAYCGELLSLTNFHIDHINPIYRKVTHLDLERCGVIRGGNKLENLNPSCISCNCSKSTFTIEQWRTQLKNKIKATRRDNSNFRILERFGIIKVVSQEVKFHFEKLGGINE